MEEERKNNLDCNRVCTANEITLDILRKYQKIQEAMDNRADDDVESNSKALNEIEVIMYGNVN
jgi:hypothetical protein